MNPCELPVLLITFAKQIVQIERGEKDTLTHGNLNSIRTLIDVRDAMESYWVASQKCEWGIPYNIGGGTSMSVGDFLDVLKSRSTVPIKSTLDKKLLRPVDVTLQIPDTRKFHSVTNWEPKYSIEESVDFLLDYYRSGDR